MSKVTSEVKVSKLQKTFERIAKDYADKTSQKEVTIIRNMKRRIVDAGVSRSILNRYIRNECKPSAKNAMIVQNCIKHYEPDLIISDIF